MNYFNVRTKSAAASAVPSQTKVLDGTLAQLKVTDVSDDSPGGYLEGYASVFGNVDSGGDIVEKGAFTKTLRERLKKGMIKLVDSHLVFGPLGGTKTIIGVVNDAKEDDYGLWFRGKMSTVQDAQDIRTKVKEGILSALSFGYDVIKDEEDPKDPTVRHLKELRLYEISVVPWGMNEKAQLTAAKSATGLNRFQIAPVETAWDAKAARERWAAFIANAKAAADFNESEFNRYRLGFLDCVSDSPEVLLVDVVNDTPQIVLKALDAALEHVARSDRRSELEEQLKVLYTRFGATMPTKASDSNVRCAAVDALLAEMKSRIPDASATLLSNMKALLAR